MHRNQVTCFLILFLTSLLEVTCDKYNAKINNENLVYLKSDITPLDFNYKVNIIEFLKSDNLNLNSISGFTSIRGIKIYESNLNKIPLFKNLKIGYIILNDNPIVKVTNTSFINVKINGWLSLEYDKIKTIEDNSFKNLDALHLDGNELETIDYKWFEKPEDIKILDVCRNKITQLQADVFKKFIKLEQLNLSHNKIKHLPEGIFPKTLTIRLKLQNIEISEFNMNLFQQIPLKIDYLDISFNRLNYLSENFMNNTSVKKFGIYGNPWLCPCLTVIEKWIGVKLEAKFDFFDDMPVCIFSKLNSNDCVREANSEVTEIYRNEAGVKKAFRRMTECLKYCVLF